MFAQPNHSQVAALPVAASATFLLARHLPIEFEFQPNDLGIVSVTTQSSYPAQQEVFWLVFCVLVSALVSWFLMRVLSARRLDGSRGIVVELIAASALVALLWLPLLLGTLLWLGLVVAAAIVVAKSPHRSRDATAGAPFRPVSTPRRFGWVWIATLVLLSTLYSVRFDYAEGLWGGLANVALGVSDLELAGDTWRFQAELGQHLLWADLLLRGELPGRDFLCIYGPLYELGLVGVWALVGRSLAALTFYEGLIHFAGMLSLLCLVTCLTRHRIAVLSVFFLVPYANLRVGFALIGLACLSRWLATSARVWCAAAGAAFGIGLLFSQEFGLAFGLVAFLALAIRADVRAFAAFALTGAVAVLPVVLWLAWNDALVPMLADLVRYPAYLVAGFGNLPFPALFESLPLGAWPDASDYDDLLLRLGYSLPVLALGGLLLSFPLGQLDPRHPLDSLRAIRATLLSDPPRLAVLLASLFALLAARSALGRTDMVHVVAVIAPVAALVCVAVERTVLLWARRETRALAVWRSLALGCLIAQTGLLTMAKPWGNPTSSGRELALLVGEGSFAADPRIAWLTERVLEVTQPHEAVFFLPNNALYSYLTRRPHPTRFVLSHQMVTSAHRAEALTDLRAAPPPHVIWDEQVWRVDAIPDSLVLGPEMMGWLRRNYEVAQRHSGFLLLRYDRAGGAAME